MGKKTHPPGQLRAEKLHQHRKNFRLDDPLHWEDNSTLLMARAIHFPMRAALPGALSML
jgi:hypothetical protein